MTIDREFWYAAQLGFNLLSKRSDPRIGSQTFTVTNLALADPDPKLFELPEGFTVADESADGATPELKPLRAPPGTTGYGEFDRASSRVGPDALFYFAGPIA